MKKIFSLLLVMVFAFSLMAQNFSATNLKNNLSTVQQMKIKADNSKSNTNVSIIRHSSNAKASFINETFATEIPATWTVTNDATSGFGWAWDAGTYASYPYGKGNACANSDATAGIGITYLTSPVVDCSSATSLYLEFNYQFQKYSTDPDNGTVEIWDGTQWVVLATYNTDILPTSASFDVTAYKNAAMQVRFKYEDQGSWDWFFNVSDVHLFEPSAHDLGIVAITPGFVSTGNTVAPTVTVHNFGGSDEATYSVLLSDGGTYSNTVSDVAVTSGSEVELTFPNWTPADGSYTLTATVTLTGDGDAGNDVLTQTVTVMATTDAFIANWDGAASNNGVLAIPSDYFTPWGVSAEMIRGMAYRNDVLYGLSADGNLGTISTTDGSFTLIGSLVLTETYWVSLAYDMNTDVMYAFGLSGTYPAFTISMYTIDVTTGAATLVAHSSHAGTAFSFAFDNNSNLYAVEHQQVGNGLLYSVDETNANMTLIGTDLGGIVSANFQGMAYDFTNNVMYLQASGASAMQGSYSIDLTTGVATLQGVPFAGQVMGFVFPYSAPVTTHAVTFNVDMRAPILAGTFVVGTDSVLVTGSILGWAQPGNDLTNQLMDDVDGDSIYTKTLQLSDTIYAYKYFKNSGWDNGEWNGNPNRTFEVAGADVTLNDVWAVISKINTVKANVTLSPNPTNGMLRVSANQNYTINVIDINGRTVATSVMNSNVATLDMSSLNSGIYFVRLSNENGTAVYKVVKQ